MAKKRQQAKKAKRSDGPGPIAGKVITAMREVRGSKVIDISAYRRGQMTAEALQETISTKEELAKLDPAHAVYVYVQNVCSVLSEQLTALPALSKIAKAYEESWDAYEPSGPPMSPLTHSYFFCWAVFDLAVGRRKETVGSIILELGRVLDMDPTFLEIVRLMQASRMGLFVHETERDGRTLLRELLTGQRVQCIVPSGFAGTPGQVWLARVLPPPLPLFDYSVVFTTPYVIARPGEVEWLAYLDRTLAKEKDRRAGYEKLMKYGPEPDYWNEYIFARYHAHQMEAVFLEGLPDDLERINWVEAVRRVPTIDILEELDLDRQGDLEQAVDFLVGDLEGEDFLTWEAVIRDEQDLELTEDHERKLDELFSFSDDDEETLYINGMPRHCEPWYETVRRVVPHLLLERFNTAAGHYEVTTDGWPRLVEAIEEHGPALSLPEGIASPLDVVPADLRHRLWLQICCGEFDNIGQKGWSLADEELQPRVDGFIEALQAHQDSVEFLELTLDKLLTVLILPPKEEQIFVGLLTKKLGLESRAAPLAKTLQRVGRQAAAQQVD